MENPFETINQQLAEITKQIGSIAAELAVRGSVDGAKSAPPKSDYIDLNEAAALTGYSAHSLRKFIVKRAVPFYHIGGKLRFREQELRDWIEARARRTAPARWEAKQQTTPMGNGN